jgi:hypothetical protein
MRSPTGCRARAPRPSTREYERPTAARLLQPMAGAWQWSNKTTGIDDQQKRHAARPSARGAYARRGGPAGRGHTPSLALRAKRNNDALAGWRLDERGGHSAASPAVRQLPLTEVLAGVRQASKREGQS